jgi:la-related protein 1
VAESSSSSPATKIIARADEGEDAAGLASDESKEKYVTYRMRALEERHHAQAGQTPRLMQGLYDFWSHFLICDFNSRMYEEFRKLALEDASLESPARYGLRALIHYYNELFNSDQPKPWGDRPVPEVFNLHFRSALSLDPSMGANGHVRV